ncbi:MAG: hypothetical protein SGILL_004997 [Bacillariaceae sp.]
MRFSLSDDVIADDDEESSQVEVEPSHPLGFASPHGKTWISLDPPTPSAVKAAIGRTTYGLFDSDSEDEDDRKENRHVQTFPPLSSYVRAETAPTSALLSAERHSKSQNKTKSYPQIQSQQQQQEDDDLYYSGDDEDEHDDNDIVLQLMKQPICSPAPKIPAAIKEALSSPPPSQRSETQRTIQSKVEEERRRIDAECRTNTDALKELVMKSEKEADVILKKKQAFEAQLKREQAARDEQERQAQEARDAQAAKAEQARKRQEELRQQQDAQQERAQAAADQKTREQAELAKKKTEHVDRAKKLVRQLAQLRQSIQPFDENKAVSKRRLGMKKIARGKLNTLSESAQKVQEVATEVSQAITVMRQDDKQVAEGIAGGQQGLTQDMTRGKRYFMDLLASNAMSRVQAETFSGIKGDAFPLSAMLSMISVENKDLNPILEAHVYTVCPTAIPVLPAPKPDATEDEVMTELGMQKKNDKFESFPAFLARTENIISFMADIMSSVPSTHTLLKGNDGAVLWLERFLDLLPPAPTAPLPLTTAPVLGAFLNAAGHMLANKHADAFQKLLSVITDDIVKRLDEGEIGKPSATRLNKILKGGFEHFRTELPAKAIPELKRKLSQRNQATVLSEDQASSPRAPSAAALLNKVRDLAVVATRGRKRALANSLLKEDAGMATIVILATTQGIVHRAPWEEVSDQLPHQTHLAELQPPAAFLRRHPSQQALLVLRLAPQLVLRPVRLAPDPTPQHLSHNRLRLAHLAAAILLLLGEDLERHHHLALGLPHSPLPSRPTRILRPLVEAAMLTLPRLVEAVLRTLRRSEVEAILHLHRSEVAAIQLLRHFQTKTNHLLEKFLSHLALAATLIRRRLEEAQRLPRVRFRTHQAIRHSHSGLHPTPIHLHLEGARHRDLVPVPMLVHLLSVGAHLSADLPALEEMLSRTKALAAILSRTNLLVETKATANLLANSLLKVGAKMEPTADSAMI